MAILLRYGLVDVPDAPSVRWSVVGTARCISAVPTRPGYGVAGRLPSVGIRRRHTYLLAGLALVDNAAAPPVPAAPQCPCDAVSRPWPTRNRCPGRRRLPLRPSRRRAGRGRGERSMPTPWTWRAA